AMSGRNIAFIANDSSDLFLVNVDDLNNPSDPVLISSDVQEMSFNAQGDKLLYKSGSYTVYDVVTSSDIASGFASNVSDHAYFTPEGNKVVYRDGSRALKAFEIFNDNTTSPPVNLISKAWVAGGEAPWDGVNPSHISNFQVAANGKVVYLADQEILDVQELFVTSVADLGAVPVEQKITQDLTLAADPSTLDPTLQRGLPYSTQSYTLSADGNKVFYIVDLDETDDNPSRQPFVVDISSLIHIPDPVALGNDSYHLYSGIATFASPDSDAVLFNAETGNNIVQLYYVDLSDPANPGTATILNGPIEPGFGAGVDSYPQLNPTSQAALLSYNPDVTSAANFGELYMVSVDEPGQVYRVNSPLPDLGSLSNFSFTEDGLNVVYLADLETQGLRELWTTPVAELGTSLRLNPIFPQGALHDGVSSFSISLGE
ncbi:MAG: hypothetical protein KDK66_07145, partial [Deltaproteobacteria bacterium]|nr:hypothetical protein [Deltaproteobacteria bacterium]